VAPDYRRRRSARERTQAGLAAARRAGRTGGRPPKLAEDDIGAAEAMLANSDIGVTQIAHRLGVSPATSSPAPWYANLAWCKLLTGSMAEAIPALGQALRLSPRDTRAGNWFGRIGLVHLLQSRTDEAILWLEKARTTSPALPFVHIWLASGYALKGATERAAAELAEARRLRGEGSYASIARMAGAEDPRVVGSYFFRRSAQGRGSGGVTRPGARGALTVS
jgi:tetratricopeptide (TPR) repeat protein